MTRLAVLGSPIAHSKSPILHAAAYRALGLDWSYDAIELTGDRLPAFLESLDDSWRGVSLTMPLKRDVVPLLNGIDAVARLTGGVNTVLLENGQRRGFNTDVDGIVRAFARSGIDRLDLVHILGAGATAASVLVAANRLGSDRMTVFARTPEKAAVLLELAATLGVHLTVRQLGVSDRSLIVPDAIVDTLPGSAGHDLSFLEPVRASSVLFAVAYDPWPGSLAAAWFAAGGTVIDGLDMLIEQALVQVRIFVTGDPTSVLDDEPAVLAAMRASVTR